MSTTPPPHHHPGVALEDTLDADEIARGLSTGWMGHRLEIREQTGSTNDDCIALARGGAPAGTVVVTDWQSAGRGRRGRGWSAPPGSAVLFSFIVRPALPLSAVGRLGMAAALAVVDAIGRTCGIAAAVKYPNDVLIEGKKVAGVLPEIQVGGDRVAWAVTGIGINVRRAAIPPGLEEQATSLEEHVARPARNALIRVLLSSLESRLEQADADPEALAAAWRSRDTVLGKPVSLALGQARLDGIAVDVDADANLILRLPDGSERRLAPSEVTFRV